MTHEPRFTCSLYVLSAWGTWAVSFALIIGGWIAHDVFVALFGIGVVAGAASLTVSICCWRMGRNLKAAFDYGREVERRESIHVAR